MVSSHVEVVILILIYSQFCGLGTIVKWECYDDEALDFPFYYKVGTVWSAVIENVVFTWQFFFAIRDSGAMEVDVDDDMLIICLLISEMSSLNNNAFKYSFWNDDKKGRLNTK